ncbi:MAG: O-antigen ligase family protein [Phycisphaerae bacterium]|jgi:O-antigen ligase
MTSLVLLIALIVLLPFALLCLHFLFGMRGSDFVFLAAVMFPAVWLSRLNLYTVAVGGVPYFSIWGVFAVMFLVFLPFGNARTSRLLSISARHTWVLLLALVGVLGLSTLANHESGRDIYRGLQASMFVLLPPLAAWAIVRACHIDKDRVMRIVGALFFVGLFISMLSIMTALAPGIFRQIVVTHKTMAETGRAFSPLGGPSATAMCLLPVYCLSGGQLLTGRRRLFALIVLACCFVALLTTLARAALVAFLVANIYLWVRYRHALARRIATFVLIALVVLLPLAYAVGRVYTLERFTKGIMDDQRSTSLAVRSASLEAAVIYGAHHLFLGGGWGLVYPLQRQGFVDPAEATRIIYLQNLPSAPKPHNLFALVFAEGGVIALLLLMLLFWRIWRGLTPPDAGVSRDGHGVVHGFRAGYLSFLVMCVGQDHLFLANKISFFFYLFVFVGLAISAYYQSETAAASSVPVRPVPRSRSSWSATAAGARSI